MATLNGRSDSSVWFRLGPLKPRLNPDARIARHVYRGETWFVLQSPAGIRHLRLSPVAYRFIAALDGQRSLRQIWEELDAADNDAAPAQDEIVDLLARLRDANALDLDLTPDAAVLLQRGELGRIQRRRQRWGNPLALRIRLFDPDRFLTALLPVAGGLFSPLGLAIWLSLLIVAGAQALLHWPELTENLADRVLSAENLFILSVTYPLLKLLHELAHGLAAKRCGAAVHEVGVSVLYLMPLPYVDVSSIGLLPERRQRMLVCAAGIMAETALAALAMLLWIQVGPGVVRALAFNVMLIGGVSTLFINGNPLLRFDGYFVVADGLEIPNLAGRSTAYWGWIARRWLLGMGDAGSPPLARGEAPWLLVYAPLSLAYRLCLAFWMALQLADALPLAGTVLAIAAVWSQILMPALLPLRYLINSPRLDGRRTAALTKSLGLAGMIVLALFALPLPYSTCVDGVIQAPEDALLRAGAEGFITRLWVQPGEQVHDGDAVLELEAPLLEAQARVIAAQVDQAEARYRAALLTEPVKTATADAERAALAARLADIRAKLAELTVRSGGEGRFIPGQAGDLVGRFARQGDSLGVVLGGAPAHVRVVIAQTDLPPVRERTVAVGVRLAGQIDRVLPARIDHTVPQSSDRLPSAALGHVGGGAIPVDPSVKDGTKALEEWFQIDLTLPVAMRDLPLGSRAVVRFQHPPEALGPRWLRALQQIFLRRSDG